MMSKTENRSEVLCRGNAECYKQRQDILQMHQNSPYTASVYVSVILAIYALGMILLLLHFVRQKYGQINFYDIYYEICPNCVTGLNRTENISNGKSNMGEVANNEEEEEDDDDEEEDEEEDNDVAEFVRQSADNEQEVVETPKNLHRKRGPGCRFQICYPKPNRKSGNRGSASTLEAHREGRDRQRRRHRKEKRSLDASYPVVRKAVLPSQVGESAV